MSFARRVFLLGVGFLSVGLAAAGIMLPLLPTTPFLLLAAACFLRSSDRLHRWLINHRWFGSYIRDYREYGGITRRAKSGTLVLLWLSLGYGIICVAGSAWLRVLLFLIGTGVTVHVLRLRTVPTARRRRKEAVRAERCTAAGKAP